MNVSFSAGKKGYFPLVPFDFIKFLYLFDYKSTYKINII